MYIYTFQLFCTNCICVCLQVYSVPSSHSPGLSSRGSSDRGDSLGPDGEEKLSKTNLYIRGLKANTTDEDLVRLCHK